MQLAPLALGRGAGHLGFAGPSLHPRLQPLIEHFDLPAGLDLGRYLDSHINHAEHRAGGVERLIHKVVVSSFKLSFAQHAGGYFGARYRHLRAQFLAQLPVEALALQLGDACQ